MLANHSMAYRPSLYKEMKMKLCFISAALFSLSTSALADPNLPSSNVGDSSSTSSLHSNYATLFNEHLETQEAIRAYRQDVDRCWNEYGLTRISPQFNRDLSICLYRASVNLKIDLGLN